MPEGTAPPLPIHIRPATLADAPRIAALGSHTFTTTFGYSLPPSDLAAYLATTYSPAAVETDILHPQMSTLVAGPMSHHPAAPEQILGFAQLTRNTTEPCLEGHPKPVELQRLYVSIEAHGLGVGRLLLEAIEAMARGEGWETLWLGVWEENFKAQGFYRKMGFEKCGHHDFVMGSCVQRDWIMRKGL